MNDLICIDNFGKNEWTASGTNEYTPPRYAIHDVMHMETRRFHVIERATASHQWENYQGTISFLSSLIISQNSQP